VSAATLRRAHAVHPITAVQYEYSPFTLDIEDPKIDLLATCRELGIGVIAYSPMGRGMLTGVKTYEDVKNSWFLSRIPKFGEDNFPNIMKLVDVVKGVAARQEPKVSAAQVAIAWVLAQGQDIVTIPGTGSVKNLEQNFAASEVELTAEDLKAIRDAGEAAEVPGDRYPPWFNYMFGETPALE
jgi:aryl-alcohol dehydrogenase-like predicted oxidoreductase